MCFWKQPFVKNAGLPTTVGGEGGYFCWRAVTTPPPPPPAPMPCHAMPFLSYDVDKDIYLIVIMETGMGSYPHPKFSSQQQYFHFAPAPEDEILTILTAVKRETQLLHSYPHLANINKLQNKKLVCMQLCSQLSQLDNIYYLPFFFYQTNTINKKL